jgi:hypothetical protein
MSAKKRRADSTRGISSSLRSLADLPGWYAGGNEGVNQRTRRKPKEKIRIVIFPPNEMPSTLRNALQYRNRFKIALMWWM